MKKKQMFTFMTAAAITISIPVQAEAIIHVIQEMKQNQVFRFILK